MLALILPSLTISPLLSRLIVKYSLSRLNIQMTLMASKCWSRSSFCLTQSPTASSSVLNQRHTMATTLLDTLSLKISRCVLNPIKTSTMRKNNIRKTKTDNVNTYIIAKTLMIQDSYRFYTFYDLNLMDLKAMGRFYQKNHQATDSAENSAYSLR